QRQQLCKCRKFSTLFARRAAIQIAEGFFGGLEIYRRAQFAKSLRGSRQVLNRPRWLSNSISPSQLVMCSRSTVTIAEHIENRNAAAEVLRRCARITLGHRLLAVKPLRLAGQIQVGCRFAGLLGNALQFRGTAGEILRGEMRLGQYQPRFANSLAIAD